MNEYGAFGGMILTGENRSLRIETCPSATSFTTDATTLTWDGIRLSAVEADK